MRFKSSESATAVIGSGRLRSGSLRRAEAFIGRLRIWSLRNALHDSMSARRRSNRSVRRWAASMAFVFTWASANWHTSRGAFEHSAAQSRELERKPCGPAPIPSSRTSFAIASLESSPPRAVRQRSRLPEVGLRLDTKPLIQHLLTTNCRVRVSLRVPLPRFTDNPKSQWPRPKSTVIPSRPHAETTQLL